MQYLPYIAVFLQSVSTAIKNSKILFYIQDIDEDCLDILCKTYQNSEFIETDIAFPKRNVERIPLKMKTWTEALSKLNGDILFLDCDTIVSKSPQGFFSDADITFTSKDEQFQINTGVMLTKNSKAVQFFYQQWTQDILNILTDEQRIEIACSAQHHFGAVDQMAFYELINFNLEKNNYVYNTPYGPISLASMPCDELNQVNSVPLNDNIYIYHYKGGWRQIIKSGEFTQYRRFYESYPMLLLFHKTLKKAKKAMLLNGASPKTVEKFSIYPFKWGLFKIKYFLLSLLNNNLYSI
ncbi:MAG: hypothetical protein HDR50_01890 [Desulfovibrio sp.]|uniref:putative nucleotide-diphospho-sugar transferase n=1 Tax=Desulfovibrio sp. TaxID=885 RepID=UPI001A6A1DC1|nr:putative nucleotide-diphospho-sugar transferase [Desulfovibrio sp.]MBD5416431.1 hypothetical protein [Desulfovibrio sp.]